MSCGTSRAPRRRTAVLLLVLALCAVDGVRAQVPAECATAECARGAGPSLRDAPAVPAVVAQDLASVDRLRLQFVDALRDFAIAQAGTLGDITHQVPAPAVSMGRTLQEWDTALATLRARAAQATPSVDLHFAMAARYLGRLSIDDGLAYLDAAVREDDRRVELHVARALGLARANRHAEALTALRRAQTLAPDDPVVRYLIAQHWSVQGRPEEAVGAWRAFIRVVPRETRTDAPRIDRLELLRETARVAPIFPMARYASGFARLMEGRLDEGVAELRPAAAGDTVQDGALRTAVVTSAVSIRRGQVQTAMSELRKHLALWPSSGELHRSLGLAYWVMGEQGDAITHLRQARDLQPADERARIALADVFISADRLAEAERELTGTLTALPESGSARYRLAQLKLGAGDLPAAVTLLRETLRLSPPIVGRDHLLYLLGSTLVKMADFEGAVEVYVQRVALNPNSPEAHRQLAEVYFLQGRHDEALGEFTAAFWLDPRDARAHTGAAQVLLRADRHADAAKAAETALAIDGTQAEARYVLGTALARLGKSDEGRAHLVAFAQQQAAAQELGRREFELDALRREAARQVSAPADAIPLLEQALALDPGSARSHRELGLALLRGGNGDRGRDHLERAQQIDPAADIARRLADLYRRSNLSEASARHEAQYERLRQVEIERRLKIILTGG